MEQIAGRVAVQDGQLGEALGFETLGGVFTAVIAAGAPLPARHSEIFSTAEDGQDRIQIHLLAGSGPSTRDARSLGTFAITEIRSAPRGAPRIEVTVEADRGGAVTLRAVDLDTRVALPVERIADRERN